jgi:hypothetical protein
MTTMTDQSFDAPVTMRRPVLGLMGEFSAGKTTLLNVLVGRELLPTRVTATRVPPIWLSYGPEQAHYVDTEGAHHSITLAELETVPLDGVAFIKIMTEAEVLADVDLFDTPGISDPNISDEVRLAIVQHLDAVLWCTHATQAWRESERSAWMSMPDKLREKSQMLVTRADTLSARDQERVMRRMRREAGEMFNAVRPISSVSAAEAMISGDAAALAESGLPALRTAMSEIAAAISAEIAEQQVSEPAAVVAPRRVRRKKPSTSDQGGDDASQLSADEFDDGDDQLADDGGETVRADPDMASLLATMARIGQNKAAPVAAPATESAPTAETHSAPVTATEPTAAEQSDADIFARLSSQLGAETPAGSSDDLRADATDGAGAVVGSDVVTSTLADLATADQFENSTPNGGETTGQTDDVFSSLISGIIDDVPENDVPENAVPENAVDRNSDDAAALIDQNAMSPAQSKPAAMPLDLSQFARQDDVAGSHLAAETGKPSELGAALMLDGGDDDDPFEAALQAEEEASRKNREAQLNIATAEVGDAVSGAGAPAEPLALDRYEMARTTPPVAPDAAPFDLSAFDVGEGQPASQTGEADDWSGDVTPFAPVGEPGAKDIADDVASSNSELDALRAALRMPVSDLNADGTDTDLGDTDLGDTGSGDTGMGDTGSGNTGLPAWDVAEHGRDGADDVDPVAAVTRIPLRATPPAAEMPAEVPAEMPAKSAADFAAEAAVTDAMAANPPASAFAASPTPAADPVSSPAALPLQHSKSLAKAWRQIARSNRIETVTDIVLALEDFFHELDDEQRDRLR